MSNKLVRNCIVCDSPDATEVFDYTFDFMVGVRGTAPDSLPAKGLGPGESSSIVKCNACGCNYIRDVLVDYQKASARELNSNRTIRNSLEEHKRAVRSIFTSKRINNNLRLLKIFEKSVRMIRSAGVSDIKVLDFGAGSAGFSNLAKVAGADLVVAYDLAYDDNIQDLFDDIYADGIRATNDLAEVAAHAPYHIIFCQSMIEHVTDPRAILRHLKQNLHENGVVYINNPIMNIDTEISQLRAATAISKTDQISYYHPGHLNYMMPDDFSRLYDSVGLTASRTYPEPFIEPKNAGKLTVLLRHAIHELKRGVVFLRPHYPRACYFLTKMTS